MRTTETETIDLEAEPDPVDFDDVTGYTDDDQYVICEKTNPRAWIRADCSQDLNR